MPLVRNLGSGGRLLGVGFRLFNNNVFKECFWCARGFVVPASCLGVGLVWGHSRGVLLFVLSFSDESHYFSELVGQVNGFHSLYVQVEADSGFK